MGIIGNKWELPELYKDIDIIADVKARRIDCLGIIRIMKTFSISRVILVRRIRWTGHLARMQEGRNVFRILAGNPTEKGSIGRFMCGFKVIPIVSQINPIFHIDVYLVFPCIIGNYWKQMGITGTV